MKNGVERAKTQTERCRLWRWPRNRGTGSTFRNDTHLSCTNPLLNDHRPLCRSFVSVFMPTSWPLANLPGNSLSYLAEQRPIRPRYSMPTGIVPRIQLSRSELLLPTPTTRDGRRCGYKRWRDGLIKSSASHTFISFICRPLGCMDTSYQ